MVNIVVNWITFKKLTDADEAEEWLKEYLGIFESAVEKCSTNEREENQEQIDMAMNELGFSSLDEMVGHWVDSEYSPCEMPIKPNKTDFEQSFESVIIVVHGRRFPENINVYVWKNSKYGLVKESDYHDLF